MDAVISLERLSLAFERDGQRTEVLQDLDLEIARGEFVALVGASGVGKSTVLRVISKLVSPSGGQAVVRAQPARDRLAVSLVFQDPRLLPWRSVLANVAFGLERLDVSRAERRQRAETALALVGLSDLGGRYPRALSGGQRQRVAIARALAVNPEVLLMDEPFSALDAITRESLQDELGRIHAAMGRTVVFVTHDIDEAIFLADRVVALVGRPAAVGAIERVEAARPRRRGDPALREASGRLRAALASGSVVI